MSKTQPVNEKSATPTATAPLDLKLEVVPLPVSDVDRAKRFYEGLGWRLDADFSKGDDWRVVQMTPPGSPCSVMFGKGYTTAVPGSVQGTFLVVDDIQAARAELIRHGAEVSDVFHFDGLLRVSGTKGRVPGAHPEGRSVRLVRHVQRSRRQHLAPPGGQDSSSWSRTQLERRDADRTPARNRRAPWRVPKPQAQSITGRSGMPHTSWRGSADERLRMRRQTPRKTWNARARQLRYDVARSLG